MARSSPRRQIIGQNARRPEEAGAPVNARRKTGPRDPVRGALYRAGASRGLGDTDGGRRGC
ncbi:hypothetical protein ALC57_17677 [Trachymyrmex cornetzi]|uniref:Uncharacterized protein n=1 Tax=Trachymyrmex cornetzi TaxID=471704 RepID=A0A151IT47_9HYME|nr:hypothetical protein ALC57_17677 [Trachymyrmex cornetzi]